MKFVVAAWYCFVICGIDGVNYEMTPNLNPTTSEYNSSRRFQCEVFDACKEVLRLFEKVV